MSDNKSDVAGVVEVQPEQSPAASADEDARPSGATARDSSRVSVKESASGAGRIDGAAAGARERAAAADGGTQSSRGKAAGGDGDGASGVGKKGPGPGADGGASGAREKVAGADATEQSLGTFLIAAREGRGLSAEDVVRETRLPPHYLRMMETNDYSEISDQLYLVPFLRRYASFLELDQEDVAMRFVREVQRADGNPGPARLDQPLVAEPRQHRGWAGAIAVVGILAIAVGFYVYESNRHRQANTDMMMPHASAGVASGSETGAEPIAPQPTR